MILEKKPITLAEVKKHVKDSEDSKLILDYLKKFSKLKIDKSNQLKEEIINLKNPKIKEENIVKIIDFLPQDQEEVNKIFTETSLLEEETNAILKITSKY